MVTSGRRGGSAARIGLTVFVTLLIVAAEFGVLTMIYDRAAPNRSQRIVVAAVRGELRGAETVRGAETGRGAEVANDALTATQRLASLGLHSKALDQTREAALVLSRDTDSAVALASLTRAVNTLGDHLAARQRTLDREAHLSYIVLLIAASLGWAVWFRKLVNRHRSLQAQVTEQQARTASEQRLAALVRNSSDVVMICDLGTTVSYVTQSVEPVLGLEVEALIGRRFTELVETDDIDPLLLALAQIGPGEDGTVRGRIRHSTGRILDVEGTVTNLVNENAVGGLVLTVRDVTARVQLEKQLTHQAFHDGLTGLANRQLFGDRLAHALERAGRRQLVVLFCDLDEFKNVNDSLGHGVGDQVLAAVAERATAVIRVGDTVARLGGDEFAILMEDIDLPAAEGIADRLLAAIKEPVTIDGRMMTVRASIGLAQATPGEMTAEEALRNADVAMYLAKSRGKGTVAQYESHLHAEALDQLALRADLQRAIHEGELRLNYQPTVDLRRGGKVVGFEALVRWQHPVRGMIPPLEFIPMAEETGLIRPLGSWVLRTACVAAVEMNAGVAPGDTPISIAVNVGAQQLADPTFVDEVFQVLLDTGLAPKRLTLEITESVMLRDLTVVIARLVALRGKGIRIAIDDFGTGYSSLAYLRNLPVDILKIDKSFIDDVVTNEQDAALAEGILAMSIGMNLATVAEGVESQKQAAWLTEADCAYGQGYLWSRPVPLKEALALLDAPVADAA